MSDTHLLVSVIVPVRDRADLFAALVGGLEHQTLRDFELVVIDDGSSDDAVVPKIVADSGLRAQVMRTPGVGAVRARVLAVGRATGAILAFTDSDCVPDPRWLERGVAAIEAGADLAQGRTVAAGVAGPLERTLEHGDDGLYATCNMFYRRSAYDAVGGFDVSIGDALGFRGPRSGRALGFSEDTFLGWAVTARGNAVYVADAVVTHAVVTPSLRELTARAWLAGGFPSLIRALPGLRAKLLVGRYFLGWRRLPVYASLLMLVLRRPLVVAPLLWWAARYRGNLRATAPLSRRFISVPVEMGLDAITAAALLWGSVRAKTIVL